MIKLKKPILLSLCVLSTMVAYDKEYTTAVETKALSVFPPETEKPTAVGIYSFNDCKTFKEHLNFGYSLFTKKNSFYPTESLSKREKLSTAFAKTAPNETSLPKETIIDLDFVHNTEIIARNQVNPTGHLLDQLTTQCDTSLFYTTFGRKRFTELITEPISDCTVLKERQALIDALVTDEELLNACEAILQKIAENEDYLFVMYKCSNKLPLTIAKNTFWSTELLNKSTATLECGRLLAYNIDHLIVPGILYTNYIIGKSVSPFVKKNGFKKTFETVTSILKITPKSYLGMLAGYAFLLEIILPLITTAHIIENNNNYRSVHNITIHNATFLKEIQHLYTVLEKHKVAHSITSIKSLDLKNTQHPRILELFNLANTWTFSGNPSVFSFMGRVLRTYKLLESDEYHNGIAPVLNAVGELESYVVLAKKIKTAAANGTPYCFATYIENSSAPYIKATNFFNPFVTKPVFNSIEMGTKPGATDGTSLIVVTGPNAGGKSTSMNGLTYAILLAQTFGIAPAHEFIITPFSKLVAHRNVSDDVLKEKSGYQAEQLSVKKIFSTLKQVNEAQGYTFITLDELFRSTTPEQGDTATKEVLEHLARDHNTSSLTLIATHFPSPTELAQTNSAVANYRMGTVLHEDGSVKQYTYTLEPGISLVRNAAQLSEAIDMFN